jgi:membrane-associated phospholipid phosphatase
MRLDQKGDVGARIIGPTLTLPFACVQEASSMLFVLSPPAWPLIAVLAAVPVPDPAHGLPETITLAVEEGAPDGSPAAAGATPPDAADTVDQEEKPSAPVPGGTPREASPEEARRRGRGWNDRRRTVRGYGSNLGHNAVRVFSLPNVVPLFVGASLATGANAVDPEMVSFFRHNEMATFGKVGSTAGGTGAVILLGAGLFSAGRIAPGDRFRSASYDAGQAILITSVYNATFKAVVHRERPNRSDHNSLPSGHTSNAFSWATVLEKHYGPKVGVPAYAVASLIGLSRMAHRAHFLSDVAAGAVLGHLVGRTVVRGNSRPASGVPAEPVVPDPTRPSLNVFPSFGPEGGGIQVVLRF